MLNNVIVQLQQREQQRVPRSAGVGGELRSEESEIRRRTEGERSRPVDRLVTGGDGDVQGGQVNKSFNYIN